MYVQLCVCGYVCMYGRITDQYILIRQYISEGEVIMAEVYSVTSMMFAS